MFDKLMDRHKNPVNILLHIIGIVLAVYGLWMHNTTWIIIAIVVIIIGHLFPYKPKTAF